MFRGLRTTVVTGVKPRVAPSTWEALRTLDHAVRSRLGAERDGTRAEPPVGQAVPTPQAGTAPAGGGQLPLDRSVIRLLTEVRNELRTGRTIPSMGSALRQRAVDQSVDHILSDSRFDNVGVNLDKSPVIDAALREVTLDGTVAEFGVYRGTSLTQIATFFPDRTVHGFDSLVGLPTAWGTKAAGAFHVGGVPPELPVTNVEFHVGWFDDTVPEFAREHSGPFALAHLDADLYSSTKTVFDHLGHWFIPGTIAVFDEYFGFHGWQHHEHKAFEEFLARTGLSFEAISLGHMNLAVRITDG